MAGKKLSLVADIPAPRADCAVSGCGALTIVREKTKTGWANFCEHHYIAYHRRQSVERCRQLGLETVEQMKAFCRKRIKGAFKRMDETAVELSKEPAEINF